MWSQFVDGATALLADLALQGDAYGVGSPDTVAGAQKRSVVRLHNRKAQTFHLLGFVLRQANIADGRGSLLVATAGTALLTVIRRTIPHP